MKAVKKVFIALSAILVWTAIPAVSANAVSIGQACPKATLGTRVSIRVNKKPVIVVCRKVAGRKKWIRAAVQTLVTTTTSTSTTVPEPVINYTDVVDPIDPTLHTITIEGMQPRTYYLYAPTESSADSKLPLLLGFHGRTADAQFFRGQSLIDTYVPTEKFIAIFINGSVDQWSSWNAGNCCSPSTQNNIDDVGLVSTIIDHTVNAYRIDQSRIWAVGHSNGGMMSYRLGCDLSEKITAIGIVGGALMDQTCNPTKPVSIMHLHGNLDPTVPYEGGGKFETPSIANSVLTLNKRFQCTNSTSDLQKSTDAFRLKYTCPEGSEVELANYFEREHEWTLLSTKEILRFLFAHPRK
jgi:polyhydroxybutyrate depolymerase